MKITIDGKYETRDGRAVRIYATDAGGKYPVHGAIWSDEEDGWESEAWTEEGQWLRSTPVLAKDLVPAKRYTFRHLTTRNVFEICDTLSSTAPVIAVVTLGHDAQRICNALNQHAEDEKESK